VLALETKHCASIRNKTLCFH